MCVRYEVGQVGSGEKARRRQRQRQRGRGTSVRRVYGGCRAQITPLELRASTQGFCFLSLLSRRTCVPRGFLLFTDDGSVSPCVCVWQRQRRRGRGKEESGVRKQNLSFSQE